MLEHLAAPAMKQSLPLVRLVFRKFFPPKIGYSVAPKNILEVIGPYTPRDKVLELLGHPHRTQTTPDYTAAGYRFANALLQINYAGESVSSVVLASLRMKWPNRFVVFPFRLAIGSSTFADVQQAVASDLLILKRDWSAKFGTYWTQQYFGFPGRYFHYSFALIDAATYPPLSTPDIATTHFSDETATIDHPEKARWNAVMISSGEEEYFHFDWSMFS